MEDQNYHDLLQPVLKNTFIDAGQVLNNSLRTGWVFCGGMNRSGSTLQYLLASELIERSGLGKRAPYVDPSEHPHELACKPSFGLSTFKSHIVTQEVARHCEQGNAVVLLTFAMS